MEKYCLIHLKIIKRLRIWNYYVKIFLKQDKVVWGWRALGFNVKFPLLHLKQILSYLKSTFFFSFLWAEKIDKKNDYIMVTKTNQWYFVNFPVFNLMKMHISNSRAIETSFVFNTFDIQMNNFCLFPCFKRIIFT